jgi:predicted transcriptional regulator
LGGKRTGASNALISKLEAEIELLERHVEMLKTIAENEPIGIIRLAEMMKCPQHKVRYSLRILEQENLIEPSTGGAVTTKRLDDFISELKVTLDNLQVNVKQIRDSLG